jgi:hypothetical protein
MRSWRARTSTRWLSYPILAMRTSPGLTTSASDQEWRSAGVEPSTAHRHSSATTVRLEDELEVIVSLGLLGAERQYREQRNRL